MRWPTANLPRLRLLRRRLPGRNRADKAKHKQDIAYVIPKEGSLLWIDMLAIPARCAEIDNAYRFLDYLLEPGWRPPRTQSPAMPRQQRASRCCPGDLRRSADLSAGRGARRVLHRHAGTSEQTRERTRLWTTVKTRREGGTSDALARDSDLQHRYLGV